MTTRQQDITKMLNQRKTNSWTPPVKEACNKKKKKKKKKENVYNFFFAKLNELECKDPKTCWNLINSLEYENES